MIDTIKLAFRVQIDPNVLVENGSTNLIRTSNTAYNEIFTKGLR